MLGISISFLLYRKMEQKADLAGFFIIGVDMKCMETNKVCNKYNKKCKVCALDDVRKIYSVNDYAEALMKKKAKAKFNESIPEECKKCTLLEKDLLHKKVKCLYRTRNNRCMLEPYI